MKLTRIRSTVFAVVTALMLAGCATGGGASDSEADGVIKGGPGIDLASRTITIGNIEALSGPAAVLGKPIHAGMKTYWDAVNDRGGIDGWKVKLLTKDSEFQTTQHVQLFNEIKSEVALLASYGSATTKAIQPLLQREELITVPQSFDSIWGADPFLAPVGTPYSIDMANALDYVTNAGAKRLKVGIIYQNDEAGADVLRGFNAAKKQYGFVDAGQLPYAVGDTDFTAQVQRMKSANADVVAFAGLPTASGPVVATAASLGFKPQWVLAGPAFLEQLITKDGTADTKPTPVANALKGALVTMFAGSWGDSKSSGMSQMIEDQQKFEPDQKPSIYFTMGYTHGKVQEAILRRALELGDLSRKGIVEAKLTLGEVDLGGLAPDVNYSRKVEPPSRQSLIQVIDPEAPGFLRTVKSDHLGKAANAIEID